MFPLVLHAAAAFPGLRVASVSFWHAERDSSFQRVPRSPVGGQISTARIANRARSRRLLRDSQRLDCLEIADHQAEYDKWPEHRRRLQPEGPGKERHKAAGSLRF